MIATETLKNAPDFLSDQCALAASLLSRSDIEGARKVLAPLVGAGDIDAVILAAKVEAADGRYAEGLGLLNQFVPRIDAGSNRQRGWFHMTRGALYKDAAAGNPDLIDRAFIEFQAGIDYQLRTDEQREEAGCALNNLALLKARFGRFDEAHDLFDQARALFADKPVKAAEVNLSTAEVLIGEKRFYEAEGFALEAMQTFRRFDEPRLLRKARRAMNLASASVMRAEVAGEG
ncbi:MAG TPA: hypothetical protein VK421_06245 [Pyrinomonadaceae bacterium]|nr:hypothetical protein [Pyrinomonadaceae bacterium]